MLGQLRRVLVDPRAAMSDRPTALAGPLALVFAIGVVAVGGLLAPGLVILEDTMPSVFPDSPAIAFATGEGAVTIPSLSLQMMALLLATPFLLWVLTALLVHALAWLVAFAASVRDDDLVLPTGVPSRAGLAARLGAFRRTLVAVGWGYAPQLLASLVTTALFLAVFFSTPTVVVTALELTPAGHAVVDLPEYPVVSAVTHAVGVVSVCWTGYVWVGGLRATRDLSLRTALAATLPVVVLLVYVSDLAGRLGLVG